MQSAENIQNTCEDFQDLITRFEQADRDRSRHEAMEELEFKPSPEETVKRRKRRAKNALKNRKIRRKMARVSRRKNR